MDDIPEFVVNSEGEKEYFKGMDITRWYRIFVMPYVMGDEHMSQEDREEVIKASEGLFIDSFTHETFDLMNNYEKLENYGDALLKGLLSGYIRNKFPHMNESQMSKMSNFYSSNSVQRKILIKTGASYIIRTAKGLDSLRVISDVFEAIFCAVFLGFERVFPKYAYYAVTNLLITFYKYIDMDPDVGEGDYKTRVTQVFDRIKPKDYKEKGVTYKNVEEKVDENYKGKYAKVDVKLVSDNYKALKDYGFIIPEGTQIAASAYSKFTSDAKADAYEQIYKQLSKLRTTRGENFSPELIGKIKMKKDLTYDDDIKISYYKAIFRAKEEGFADISVYVSQKPSDKISKVRILAGIDKDGNKTRLGVVRAPYKDRMKDRLIGERFLLKTYVSKGRTDEFIDMTA